MHFFSASVSSPLCCHVCCFRSQADIAAAAKPADITDGSKLDWDTPKEDEDISKMPQHAKVSTHASATLRRPSGHAPLQAAVMTYDSPCSVCVKGVKKLQQGIVLLFSLLTASCCCSCCTVSCRVVLCHCVQIIGKGVPEDAMAGVPDKQVPLPDELVNFQYMYNSTGSKVRRARHCICSSSVSVMDVLPESLNAWAVHKHLASWHPQLLLLLHILGVWARTHHINHCATSCVLYVDIGFAGAAGIQA